MQRAILKCFCALTRFDGDIPSGHLQHNVLDAFNIIFNVTHTSLLSYLAGAYLNAEASAQADIVSFLNQVPKTKEGLKVIMQLKPKCPNVLAEKLILPTPQYATVLPQIATNQDGSPIVSYR